MSGRETPGCGAFVFQLWVAATSSLNFFASNIVISALHQKVTLNFQLVIKHKRIESLMYKVMPTSVFKSHDEGRGCNFQFPGSSVTEIKTVVGNLQKTTAG